MWFRPALIAWCILSLFSPSPAAAESPKEPVLIGIFSPGIAVDDVDNARFVIDPYVEYLVERVGRPHKYEVFFEQEAFEDYLRRTPFHFLVVDTVYYLKNFRRLGLELMFQARDEAGRSVNRYVFYGPRSGIRRLEDLRDKRIAVARFTYRSLLYYWPLAVSDGGPEGLDPAKVTFVPRSLPEEALQLVLDGEADVAVASQANLAVLRDMKPAQFKRLSPFFTTAPVPSFAVVARSTERVGEELAHQYDEELGRMHEVGPGQFTLVVLGAHSLARLHTEKELVERLGRPQWALALLEDASRAALPPEGVRRAPTSPPR